MAPTEIGSTEVHFAKKLANNSKKIRDSAVKRLKIWLGSRCQKGKDFQEKDMLKLWKGLFYCMWFSDKFLVQEELADNLAKLLHACSNHDAALLFLKAFYTIMGREWIGIDRLRLDKFYMLIRKIVNQSFHLLKAREWRDELLVTFADVLSEGPACHIDGKYPDGIRMFVSEIFFEELEKVCGPAFEGVGDGSLLIMVKPFFTAVAFTQNPAVLKTMRQTVVETALTLAVKKETSGMARKLDAEGLKQILLELVKNMKIATKNRKYLYKCTRRLKNVLHPKETPCISNNEPLVFEEKSTVAKDELFSTTKKSEKKKRKLLDTDIQEKKEEAILPLLKEDKESVEPCKKKAKRKKKKETGALHEDSVNKDVEMKNEKVEQEKQSSNVNLVSDTSVKKTKKKRKKNKTQKDERDSHTNTMRETTEIESSDLVESDRFVLVPINEPSLSEHQSLECENVTTPLEIPQLFQMDNVEKSLSSTKTNEKKKTKKKKRKASESVEESRKMVTSNESDKGDALADVEERPQFSESSTENQVYPLLTVDTTETVAGSDDLKKKKKKKKKTKKKQCVNAFAEDEVIVKEGDRDQCNIDDNKQLSSEACASAEDLVLIQPADDKKTKTIKNEEIEKPLFEFTPWSDTSLTENETNPFCEDEFIQAQKSTLLSDHKADGQNVEKKQKKKKKKKKKESVGTEMKLASTETGHKQSSVTIDNEPTGNVTVDDRINENVLIVSDYDKPQKTLTTELKAGVKSMDLVVEQDNTSPKESNSSVSAKDFLQTQEDRLQIVDPADKKKQDQEVVSELSESGQKQVCLPYENQNESILTDETVKPLCNRDKSHKAEIVPNTKESSHMNEDDPPNNNSDLKLTTYSNNGRNLQVHSQVDVDMCTTTQVDSQSSTGAVKMDDAIIEITDVVSEQTNNLKPSKGLSTLEGADEINEKKEKVSQSLTKKGKGQKEISVVCISSEEDTPDETETRKKERTVDINEVERKDGQPGLAKEFSEVNNEEKEKDVNITKPEGDTEGVVFEKEGVKDGKSNVIDVKSHETCSELDNGKKKSCSLDTQLSNFNMDNTGPQIGKTTNVVKQTNVGSKERELIEKKEPTGQESIADKTGIPTVEELGQLVDYSLTNIVNSATKEDIPIIVIGSPDQDVPNETTPTEKRSNEDLQDLDFKTDDFKQSECHEKKRLRSQSNALRKKKETSLDAVVDWPPQSPVKVDLDKDNSQRSDTEGLLKVTELPSCIATVYPSDKAKNSSECEKQDVGKTATNNEVQDVTIKLTAIDIEEQSDHGATSEGTYENPINIEEIDHHSLNKDNSNARPHKNAPQGTKEICEPKSIEIDPVSNKISKKKLVNATRKSLKRKSNVDNDYQVSSDMSKNLKDNPDVEIVEKETFENLTESSMRTKAIPSDAQEGFLKHGGLSKNIVGESGSKSMHSPTKVVDAEVNKEEDLMQPEMNEVTKKGMKKSKGKIDEVVEKVKRNLRNRSEPDSNQKDLVKSSNFNENTDQTIDVNGNRERNRYTGNSSLLVVKAVSEEGDLDGSIFPTELNSDGDTDKETDKPIAQQLNFSHTEVTADEKTAETTLEKNPKMQLRSSKRKHAEPERYGFTEKRVMFQLEMNQVQDISRLKVSPAKPFTPGKKPKRSSLKGSTQKHPQA